MKQTILIPDLGADSLEVTAVLVQAGDAVAEEQGIISVEGEKASMDVPSSAAGTVVSVLVKKGDRVKKGMPLLELEVSDGAPVSATAAPPPPAAPATPAPTPAAATPSPPSAAPAPTPMAPAPAETVKKNLNVHASPAVRRLAGKYGADLTKVTGTGRKGRILEADVEAWIKQTLTALAHGPAPSAAGGLQVSPVPEVDFTRWGEVEVVPLSKIQKISGPALHRNWVTIPHVTQFDEADITELEAFRTAQNGPSDVKARGFKITPLVFIMKAVAKTLELHPKMNASLSFDGQSLVLKKYIHLGVAVDTPNGLVVPVLRDVNKRTISDLSAELFEASQKARNGQLTIDAMKGSSFTISSLGGIGGTAFTPIVNAPDVGILGVSKARTMPVWNGREFLPRLMLPLSLSYDHRIIDGADAARFITTLRGALEDIRKIIL